MRKMIAIDMASSCKRNHVISIENIANDSVISYPLVFINGLVTNTHTCCSMPVSVYVNEISTPRLWNVTNSRYRGLIELKPGKSDIVLKFCSRELRYNITYTPIISDTSVLPVFIICKDHNGCIQAPADEDKSVEVSCKRMALGISLMQSIYAEKLNDLGYGRKTFSVELDQDFKTVCLVYKSNLSVADIFKMSEYDIWYNISKELMTSEWGTPNRKFFGCLSATYFQGISDVSGGSFDDIINATSGYTARGGGNLALFSSPFFGSWPIIDSEIIPRFLSDASYQLLPNVTESSNYNFNLNYGECFSLSLGGACHELGHMFNLGHAEYGIMGRGYVMVGSMFTGIRGKHRWSAGTYHLNLKTNCHQAQCILTQNQPLSTTKLDSACNITKIHRPNSVIITKSKDGGFVLDESSTSILNYHKWFNNIVNSISASMEYYSFPFEETMLFPKYLRAIELRSSDNGFVEKYWLFNKDIIIGLRKVNMAEMALKDCKYFMAIDKFGNMLKNFCEPKFEPKIYTNETFKNI